MVSPTPLFRSADHRRDREDEEEYRVRMRLNLVAAIVILGLLTFGIWLADEMVAAQKVQGCYASGFHSCSLI
jgi:uncharacterized membrane protein